MQTGAQYPHIHLAAFRSRLSVRRRFRVQIQKGGWEVGMFAFHEVENSAFQSNGRIAVVRDCLLPRIGQTPCSPNVCLHEPLMLHTSQDLSKKRPSNRQASLDIREGDRLRRRESFQDK